MRQVAKAAEAVQPLPDYPPHEYEIRLVTNPKSAKSGTTFQGTRTNRLSLKHGLGRRLENPIKKNALTL